MFVSVALHAQSKYAMHGWVAGSEITTRGLADALIDKGATVALWAPFSYPGIDDPWDVFLIEGFSGPLLHVIRRVRRRNPRVKVIHWCLDTYPSLDATAALPVDGFLTNSRLIATQGFQAAADLLGISSAWFHEADMVPRHFAQLAAAEPTGAAVEEDPTLVVYLGQPSYGKTLLAPALLAISEQANLEIYGSAWDRFAAEDAAYSKLAACCWRGALEATQISTLYRRAKVVLGTTESLQRKLGMVNNRVFEALASDAQFVAVEETDFPELRSVLGSQGVVVHTALDAANAVVDALRRPPRDPLVETYASRAAALLSFADQIEPRPELVVALYDSKLVDWEWLYGLLPALVALDFRLRLVDVASIRDSPAWCHGASLVIARGIVAPSADDPGCARQSSVTRPPPRLLLSSRCTESSLLMHDWDVVVSSDDSCSFNAPTALGLDIDAFVPTGPTQRDGRVVAGDRVRPESFPAVLQSAAVVEAQSRFEILAGLAAGAVVQVPPDRPDLAALLDAATHGGEADFRERYSLDALSRTLRAAVRGLTVVLYRSADRRRPRRAARRRRGLTPPRDGSVVQLRRIVQRARRRYPACFRAPRRRCLVHPHRRCRACVPGRHQRRSRCDLLPAWSFSRQNRSPGCSARGPPAREPHARACLGASRRRRS